MKRVVWTVALGLIGFAFGWKGQSGELNIRQLIIATLWAGCIGYGFGSIFDQRVAGKRLILYWSITLALVGLFFGPLLPTNSFILGQAVGALIAGVMGTLVGMLQLKLARRKLQSPAIHI